MSKDNQVLEELTSKEYEHGWTTNIETDSAPKGLNEDIIRFISAKKNEPGWMLEWRLKAFRYWLTLEAEEPKWANIKYPPINYQDIIYYSAPKQKINLKSLDEIDPELRKTFEKLGISLDEQKRLSGVAVDAVIDSVSIATTFKEQLAELGIIFCSMSEAIQHHPDLVKQYLSTVVPWWQYVLGIVYVATILYLPTGLMGIPERLRQRQAKSGNREAAKKLASATS